MKRTAHNGIYGDGSVAQESRNWYARSVPIITTAFFFPLNSTALRKDHQAVEESGRNYGVQSLPPKSVVKKIMYIRHTLQNFITLYPTFPQLFWL
ncbi:unnamed protein product [Trifolium pratense]|uniref:Uncharacterized protein n=1 Tax=Trifolium pratense TaxID=57577 RepID=A0ACB0LJS8_TRIPR|nr:unnamed protein product [Trifolium pratense]